MGTTILSNIVSRLAAVTSRRSILTSSLSLIALAVVNLFSQDDSSVNRSAVDSRPRFDVLSIKPVSPFSREPVDFRVDPGGRLSISNLNLKIIIQEAFSVKDYQIIGGPNWLINDRFDFAAQSEGTPARKDLMAMLQAGLVERCQMKWHWITRRGNIFVLVVAKGGSKLMPSLSAHSRISLLRNTPADQKGVSYKIEAKRTSMPQLAEYLSKTQERPVVDRTGLKGEFDFQLTYSTFDDPDGGPQIFTALAEQLGLKLSAKKGEIPMLVIDHVARPSEN